MDALAGAPTLHSCSLAHHNIKAAAFNRLSCQRTSAHRLSLLLPPALLLPRHHHHTHTLRRKSSHLNGRQPYCTQASTAITFHVENTTVTVPLSQAVAMGLSKAIEDVLNTFREKEKDERSRRWESMEFKHTEDGVFVEFFCNPNAYANPFQAKVYLTSSVEGVCSSREFGSKLLYKGVNKLLSRGYKKKMELANRWYSDILLAAFINFPAFLGFTDSAHAESSSQELDMIYGDIGAGSELGVQVLYLAALLGLVGVGSFFVVRQLLIRRELESAAKVLQDRVRTGEALPVEYFELGAVMLRKKFFVLAAKYLEQAIEKWDGDPQDLAQVHNALGFSLVSDGKTDKGIAEYEKAVKLQPGYVVAWNNLGSAYEKKKNLPKALKAYEQALFFDPNNSVAREYRDALKKRVDRLAGIPVKYD